MDVKDKNNFVSQSINQKQLPSLNGLRGISIILVIMFHLNLFYNPILIRIFNGGLGVNIFFVLSGFLITTLCIKEIKLTGNLSLKSFYIRRILRIFPVAYLFIGTIFLLNLILHLNIAKIQFFGAMFYITNISYFRSHSFTWFFGHYWSLSVEEQFYIIFPFILKKKENIFFFAIVFIALILPFLCLLEEFVPTLNRGLFYGLTHYFIKFQSISVGCIFSIMSFRKSFDFEFIGSTKILGNIIAFFLLFYLGYDEFYSIKAVYINLLISILTGYIIISNITESTDFFYRLLNAKLLSFIGVLSYSIYIWQQIFTSGDSSLSKIFVTYPTNLIFIIIVPIISYFCYERYFLKFKSKFSHLK